MVSKRQPDTPSVGNGPFQRVKAEESFKHKWVNIKLLKRILSYNVRKGNCWRALNEGIFWHALNEHSNQPAHPRSLIWVFVVRMNKLYILGCTKCALNEYSNQPVHPRCLIWVFVVRMNKLYILGCTKCALNEYSNQPAHPRCLIWVCVVRIKKLCILGYPKWA